MVRSTLCEAFCFLLVWLLVVTVVVGCGQDPAPAAPEIRPSVTAERTSAADAARPPAARLQNPRSLADLMDEPTEDEPTAADEASESEAAPAQPPRELPPLADAKLASEGVRRLDGRHLTLYTDLPAEAEIDRLPQWFDQAVPQWAEYLGLDAAAIDGWRVRGFLISDKARFEELGLLPSDLPPFRHGYAREGQLWLYEQPSDYYRRHLLLHEGVHALMYDTLSGCGPPWYMEGLAELLATHALREGRLQVRQFPVSREETPHLGRIKLVQEAYAAKRAMTLPKIMQYDNRAHLETEPYAWCWAATAFLDGHPEYGARFRQMTRHVLDADFNQQLQRLYADDWAALGEQWQLFVAGLEHNHDLVRTAVDFTPGQPLTTGAARCTVAADRGWQNSGIRVSPGVRYQITAAGQFQIADQPRPWISEAGGVTLRYYQNQPLGVLLAAVHPDDFSTGPSPLLRPQVLGSHGVLTPKTAGTLFFRLNDSAGELEDNAGAVEVEVATKGIEARS